MNSSRSTELAPIRRDRTLENDIDYLLTNDRTPDRRRVLREAPSPALKERLYVRCEQLKAALLPARQSDVAQLIGQLFLGFGSARANVDDAQAVTAQYCIALAGLPLWAIREACRKFASGNVTAWECPHWNRSFAPSSAQLSTLANAIASPLYEEARKIDDVLTGYIRHVPDERERQESIRKQLEEHEHYGRERERERASHPTYDEIVAEMQARGIALRGARESAAANWHRDGPRDGNYMQRIAEDLAVRKARNAAKAALQEKESSVGESAGASA
jgi:hypothetical protein